MGLTKERKKIEKLVEELGSPLTSVIGFTQLLLKEAEKAEDMYKQLKIIEESALKCKKIHKELISLIKQEGL